MSFAGRPATVHLSVSAATGPHVPELLDVAAPALREAVLVAFLDRLQRPVTPPGA